jgi:hypothetical protein
MAKKTKGAKKGSTKKGTAKPAKKGPRTIAPEKGQHAGGSATKREPDATPAVAAAIAKARDPRIPPVGTTITRVYKGKTISVLVTESGYEHDGTWHSSLSALATKLADGTPKNGLLWFGLTKRPPAGESALAQTPAVGVDQDQPEQTTEKKRAPRRTKTTRAGRDPAPVAEGIDAPATE